MGTKVVAIVGSYRKDGVTSGAVEAILDGAREKGAQTHLIQLTEQKIEFCTNCRQCAQAPGPERGKCPLQDDLESILTEIEVSDAVILGSPVNFYNATALFRRFQERLLGYAYWPWGKFVPSPRSKQQPRKAVLVASAAMPGFLIPIATGAAKALRVSAQMLGAKPIASLWIGQAANESHPPLSAQIRERARRIGWKLAQ